MNKRTQERLLKIVKQNYSEIAKQYNETRKKNLEPLWSRLVKFADKAKDGDKVLDVGCGNGRLLEAFESKKIKYLGVDDSEGLLAFAKKQKAGNDFRRCNILSLGNLSETDFDWVYSIAVLHHLPGRDLRVKALRQIRNKVGARGTVVVTVWNMWSEVWQKKNFRKLILKFWLLGLIGKNGMDFGDILVDWKNPQGGIVSQRYYHAFRKGELKRLAKKAGLRVKELKKDQYNYYLVLQR